VHEFRPAHVIAEDRALAEALQRGEEDAVRTIYARYASLVFTVAMRILHDRQLAEDVVQHTFLQAWRAADRFEPGRDFAPWLATIARRRAIDVQRYEHRRPTERLDDGESTGGAGSPPSVLVELPPSAEQIEVVWAVRAAIDLLDDDERTIVRLQHVDGWTHSQIAEQLDLPVGTVKSRSFRAHRRLANRLRSLDVSKAESSDAP
jgi:RNA polymerase sigma-70 factor (ECF subfamily)